MSYRENIIKSFLESLTDIMLMHQHSKVRIQRSYITNEELGIKETVQGNFWVRSTLKCILPYVQKLRLTLKSLCTLIESLTFKTLTRYDLSVMIYTIQKGLVTKNISLTVNSFFYLLKKSWIACYFFVQQFDKYSWMNSPVLPEHRASCA